MPLNTPKLVQCNHPGCNEHSMETCPEVDWNCGRHQPKQSSEVDSARQIILDALIEFGGRQLHGAQCRAQAFQKLNRSCPPTHPIWKYAPKCDCVIGRMSAWLINNTR